MIRLKLLTLCLLVSFKSFSQTDTINKVILSEETSRKVIKELIEGDACKKISALKDDKINNLESIISSKDSIISTQDKYIKEQNKLLEKPNKLKIHGFAGMQTRAMRLEFLSFYARGMMSLYKVNVGMQYNIIMKESYVLTAFVEYKLF